MQMEHTQKTELCHQLYFSVAGFCVCMLHLHLRTTVFCSCVLFLHFRGYSKYVVLGKTWVSSLNNYSGNTISLLTEEPQEALVLGSVPQRTHVFEPVSRQLR